MMAQLNHRGSLAEMTPQDGCNYAGASLEGVIMAESLKSKKHCPASKGLPLV